MNAEDQGGVPVPLVAVFALAGLGTDIHGFLAFPVIAYHATILRFGIHDVRVCRVDLRPEAIPAVGHKPVIGENTAAVRISRGTSHAVVVLRATVNVVEGKGVIHLDTVELGYREVRFELEFLSAVKGLINPAVATDKEVLCIVGIDPHGMIVHMPL